jgi:hypothetical protein
MDLLPFKSFKRTGIQKASALRCGEFDDWDQTPGKNVTQCI